MTASKTYRGYFLGLLLVMLAFNGVDRLALSILSQSIKVDLHLTDTQLGLLTGIAFALFYSTFGIPIARWADRGNRVLIISVTCFLWSAGGILCGLAAIFFQLLVLRAFVGIGVAGGLPPAQALLADNFTRAERPRATAVYLLGGPLSSLFGALVAGRLNELYGWRWTFVLLGLPGIALSVLAWFTLREPRISSTATSRSSGAAKFAEAVRRPAFEDSENLPLAGVCTTLWSNKTFRQLLLGWMIVSFCSAGIYQWLPAFFIRSFAMGTAELGGWYTLIFGFGGAVATFLGGVLASRYASSRESLQLKVIALLYCFFGTTTVGMFLSTTLPLALVMLSFGAVGVCAISAPLLAIIMALVPERMRAQSVAILYLCSILVGNGLGPLAVGMVSDLLRPALGDESLRYASIAFCPAYLWGAWQLWRASRTVSHDVSPLDSGEFQLAA